MKKFTQLELWAERLIEGTFARLFGNRDNTVSEKKSGPAGNAVPVTGTTRELRLAARSNTARQWWIQFNSRQINLGQPVVSVGRAADNDIVIDDPALPAHYAQLRWRDGRYHLQVLSPPSAQQPLTPGDKIVMGGTKLTVVVQHS